MFKRVLRVFRRKNGLEEKFFHSMRELLNQTDFDEHKETDESLLTKALFEYMVSKGIHFPELFPMASTIGDLEVIYKFGYSAIINDGKLIGFRKEKAL